MGSENERVNVFFSLLWISGKSFEEQGGIESKQITSPLRGTVLESTSFSLFLVFFLFSACPTGDPLESQLCLTTLEKGITIIFLLCLELTFERISESASSSSLRIVFVMNWR